MNFFEYSNVSLIVELRFDIIAFNGTNIVRRKTIK